MERKKIRIPVFLKVLIVITAVFFFVKFSINFLNDLYRFPRDSLANYPCTEWKCDKLGMELFVDEDGNISGTCEIDSELISLDATAYKSTTWHSNYMECFNREDVAKMIYLHCFYRNIENGVLYVIVNSTDSTLDLNVATDYMLYKFEKQ